MLLKALYDYATSRRLLDELPLQPRQLHALVPLDAAGQLRLPHLVPVSHQDERGREVAGRNYQLPRFPGENNGGKAYFLAESSIAVFGRDKKTGQPIPSPAAAGAKNKDQNPTKAYLHFWRQIQAAFDATGDPRLAAMLAFRRELLGEADGLIQCGAPFLRMRAKDKGKKKGELEYVANTGATEESYVVVEKATFGFSVDGVPVTLDDPDDLQSFPRRMRRGRIETRHDGDFARPALLSPVACDGGGLKQDAHGCRRRHGLLSPVACDGGGL